MMRKRRSLLGRLSPTKPSPRHTAQTLHRRALMKTCKQMTKPGSSVLGSSSLAGVQFGAATKANLKVVIRVRPPNAKEIEKNASSIVDIADEHMLVFDPKVEDDPFFYHGVKQRRDLSKRQKKDQKFIFERVFKPDSTNQEVFTNTTKDIVDTLLDGYNCSVFAYGATGSGKTFTMVGKPECPGITLLTLMELYRRIEAKQKEEPDLLLEVSVSYLEVYNESVWDLLKPKVKALQILEMGQSVQVNGLSYHSPDNPEHLMELLAEGNRNRQQHPTDANAESSRSHAVFQVLVKQNSKCGGVKSNVSVAKLSMIDLAGSERASSTGCRGVRLKEGANINRSLLALGNCINALADGKPFIPYRDSKLTRLLKDSLGGNCRSVMIATVSGASTSFEDTFNTLRYANRAKTIKTTGLYRMHGRLVGLYRKSRVNLTSSLTLSENSDLQLKKNQMSVDTHVSQYVKIVEALKGEVILLKEQTQQLEGREKEKDEIINDLRKQLKEYEDRPTTAPAEVFTPTSHQIENDEAVTELVDALRSSADQLQATNSELLTLVTQEKELTLRLKLISLKKSRMSVLDYASRRLAKSLKKLEKFETEFQSKLDSKRLKITELELKAKALTEDIQELQRNSLTDSNVVKTLLADIHLEHTTLHHESESRHLRECVRECLGEMYSSHSQQSALLKAVKDMHLLLHSNKMNTEHTEQTVQDIVSSMEYRIAFADGDSDSPLDVDWLCKLNKGASKDSPVVTPNNHTALQRKKSILKGSSHMIDLTKNYSSPLLVREMNETEKELHDFTYQNTLSNLVVPTSTKDTLATPVLQTNTISSFVVPTKDTFATPVLQTMSNFVVPTNDTLATRVLTPSSIVSDNCSDLVSPVLLSSQSVFRKPSPPVNSTQSREEECEDTINETGTSSNYVTCDSIASKQVEYDSPVIKIDPPSFDESSQYSVFSETLAKPLGMQRQSATKNLLPHHQPTNQNSFNATKLEETLSRPGSRNAIFLTGDEMLLSPQPKQTLNSTVVIESAVDSNDSDSRDSESRGNDSESRGNADEEPMSVNNTPRGNLNSTYVATDENKEPPSSARQLQFNAPADVNSTFCVTAPSIEVSAPNTFTTDAFKLLEPLQPIQPHTVTLPSTVNVKGILKNSNSCISISRSQSVRTGLCSSDRKSYTALKGMRGHNEKGMSLKRTTSFKPTSLASKKFNQENMTPSNLVRAAHSTLRLNTFESTSKLQTSVASTSKLQASLASTSNLSNKPMWR